MSHNIYYIMPAMVCIVWAGIFLMRKRNTTQRMALPLLMISALYFVMFVHLFTPAYDYRKICIVDMAIIPLALSLLASLLIFIHAHLRNKFVSNILMQWFYAPVIAESSIVWVLYYIVGLDNAARFYALRDKINVVASGKPLFESLPAEFNTDMFRIFYFFDTVLLNILLLAFSIVIIATCCMVVQREDYRFGDLVGFYFRRHKTNSAKSVSGWIIMILLTVSPLILFGRTYIVSEPWIGMVIALLESIEIFMLCHCEMLSDREGFTFKEMVNVNAEAVPVPSSSLPVQNPVQTNAKNSTLIDSVRRAFDEDLVWMDPDLKLVDLAWQLHTNRNKLSLAISQVYGMDYKTLIAELRIQKAKQLMTAEPTATMDYIAMNCGFHETSVFFRRFKDITGSTPTEWKLLKGAQIPESFKQIV